GWRRRGRRAAWWRGPRANLIFVLPPNVYVGPPVGGTFWFPNFILAPSLEIWSETISGGEGVLAGKWGGLFLGYLLGKNFRRRDRDHLVPPRRMDAQSAVPRCAIEARAASGSETPRVHNVASAETFVPFVMAFRQGLSGCRPATWARRSLVSVP